jgi:hypothetical protein
MTRCLVAFAALLVAGCAHEERAVVASAAPTTPPPVELYFKGRARGEEFQRTRAACLMRQAEAESAAPNSSGRVTVYQLCMRANGWVLASKT